jgi:hypothetical protein
MKSKRLSKVFRIPKKYIPVAKEVYKIAVDKDIKFTEAFFEVVEKYLKP